MKWQAVFFDFDGVILDSVNVKTKAFGKMFSKHGPEIEGKVIKYHLENGGVSRFDKFRHYYNELLQENINDKIVADLSKEFSELVVQDVVNSNFIEGALETLEELYEESILTYVVSGTPQKEMVDIVRQKGLEKYFAEVHGSPRKKWDITANILSRKKLNPSECIFIGDSLTDYRVSEETGVRFLGIVPKNASSIFPPEVKTSATVKI